MMNIKIVSRFMDQLKGQYFPINNIMIDCLDDMNGK